MALLLVRIRAAQQPTIIFLYGRINKNVYDLLIDIPIDIGHNKGEN